MPKMKKGKDEAKLSELPTPLRNSSKKAQRTFAKAHDSAAETYGEGERAHRAAWAAVKHSFEKRGDRWVEKDSKGPSDPRAKNPRARQNEGETFGGVDYEGSTKEELYERAKELDIDGRSSMSKRELARAISKEGG